MIQLLIWLLSQPMLWAAASIILGPYFFFRGFRVLQRQRLIADTPRSSIRSAALGLVELRGKAIGPYTLVAPLSGTDCLYYRLVIESNPQGDLSNKLRELSAPFFLDDGTGRVMVYPHGAELQMPPSSERSEYGKLATAFGRFSEGSPEFAQEYAVRHGDTIFVLGTLRENPWSKKDPVAECTELSRIGPGFVSEAEADLIRREAYPYLNPKLPAGARLDSENNDSQNKFNLHPPVILMKDKNPLVISPNSQRELVAKLKFRSLLYVWGGAAAALWGLWKVISYAEAARLFSGNS
jgi:hypothetical protein